MGNGFIALVIAGGAGGYCYKWFYKRTANTQNSAIAAGILGLLAFLISLFILLKIPA